MRIAWAWENWRSRLSGGGVLRTQQVYRIVFRAQHDSSFKGAAVLHQADGPGFSRLLESLDRHNIQPHRHLARAAIGPEVVRDRDGANRFSGAHQFAFEHSGAAEQIVAKVWREDRIARHCEVQYAAVMVRAFEAIDDRPALEGDLPGAVFQ